MLHWYHVDIFDLGTARLSWRRLWSLIEHLPRESHYALAANGEQAAWGYSEHLLALVVDSLAVGNWMFASANSKSKVQRPDPIRRPGERPAGQALRGRSYTSDEMRKLLATWGTGMTDQFDVREV